jgi:hypothetical protein
MTAARATHGAVAIWCISAFFTGCGSATRQRASIFDSAGNSREALALTGVNRLREAYNRGDCKSIFDEADLVFQLRESQQAWLTECEEMRRKLGYWPGFPARLEHGPGVPLSIVVYGEATFASGSWRTPVCLATVWHFDHGRAELFSLFWAAGKSTPLGSSPFKWQRRYLDPAPKRDREPA